LDEAADDEEEVDAEESLADHDVQEIAGRRARLQENEAGDVMQHHARDGDEAEAVDLGNEASRGGDPGQAGEKAARLSVGHLVRSISRCGRQTGSVGIGRIAWIDGRF
jgi:hypothetical protein